MIHEFGHLIGLDHSQINRDCLYAACVGNALEGLPTMFPVLIDEVAMSTPATDDMAAISALYPGASFSSSTGHITGHVFFSDGVTPAQGFNVIARLVSNPEGTAVSNVSGYLFTSDAGNPLVQYPGVTPSPFGSRDTTLIGAYDIPGLPPGIYTIEVEAINNSGQFPFTGSSSVGPIGTMGFQFPLPSLLPTPPPCSPEFLVSGGTAQCYTGTEIPIAAGQLVNSGTDVILIATPPRYDAWEDGP